MQQAKFLGSRVAAGLLVFAMLVLPWSGVRAADPTTGFALGFEEALASPSRPAGDIERDAGTRPAEVLSFLGVGEGMTAVDLIAAGGYWSEVVAAAVGPTGKVYAQNPPAVLAYRDGANAKAIAARLADGRLANVERFDGDLGDLPVAPGSVDVALTSLNFHDIYNGTSPAAAQAFLGAVRGLLKPGGVLAIIDHEGGQNTDYAAVHRIPSALVIEAATQAGFEIGGQSDLLANPADDHTGGVFDPALRGQTDRFLLKLVRPK